MKYYCKICKKEIDKRGRSVLCSSCCKIGVLKIKREKRICSCGCNVLFECKINSNRKFINHHHSKNKILNKETKKLISLNRKKFNRTDKGKNIIRKASIKRKETYNKLGLGKGDKNPYWKGGISSLYSLIRATNETDIWRTKVFQRDHYTCQECGKTNCYIEAHHIKAFGIILGEFLDEYIGFDIQKDKDILVNFAKTYKPFWNIKNGITLCKKCHNKKPKRNYKILNRKI